MKVTPALRREGNKETITACNGQEEAWPLSVRRGRYRLADQERPRRSEFRHEETSRRTEEIVSALTATVPTQQQRFSLGSFTSFATGGIVFPSFLCICVFIPAVSALFFSFCQKGDCFGLDEVPRA